MENVETLILPKVPEEVTWTFMARRIQFHNITIFLLRLIQHQHTKNADLPRRPETRALYRRQWETLFSSRFMSTELI